MDTSVLAARHPVRALWLPIRGSQPWLVVAAAVLGVLLGMVAVVLKIEDGSHPAADTALSAVSGFLFLAAGLLSHLRLPANGCGPLMVLVGIGFFAEDLQLSREPVVFTAGLLLVHASAPFLVHLVLAFPYGRLPSRSARVLTRAGYLVAFGFALLATLFTDAAARLATKPANLLLIRDSPAVTTAAGLVFDGLGAVIAGGVVVSLAHRYLTGDRQLRAPIATALIVAVVAGSASAASSAVGADSSIYPVLLAVYKVGFCLWPLAFLAGMLLARPGPSAITDLLIAARDSGTLAELRDLLATALHDPSLRLASWHSDSGTYVDTTGNRLDLAGSTDRAAVTLADSFGRPVGALTHRVAPWEDPRLAHAVATLAGLVLDNRRLAAELGARLAEVRASRARLVALADEERRRVERDLHDGAQQRLVAVALGTRLAQQRAARVDDPDLTALLAATTDGIEAAITELRELARGIHPTLLTEAGLGPAVADLVDRIPLPATLTASTLPRLPGPVEATVYFVVSETLTNALKHANATRADVRLALRDGTVRVEVVDDGIGGAALVAGSGLCGLRDRVHALDGELTVRAGPGSGTAVVAEIPTG